MGRRKLLLLLSFTRVAWFLSQLTTFRDVFVSLDLPYSAIRGEDLCMKAFAYNYYNRPLYVSYWFIQLFGLLPVHVNWFCFVSGLYRRGITVLVDWA